MTTNIGTMHKYEKLIEEATEELRSIALSHDFRAVDGRSVALAVTKLEEAGMWLDKAIRAEERQ